jgi:hypothetical protein
MINLSRLANAWRSKTVWFNALLLAAIPLYQYFQENLEIFKPLLGEGNYSNLLVVIGIVNVLLRFQTTTDLANK